MSVREEDDEDSAKIGRGIGIFLAWGVLMLSALNYHEVTGSPHYGPWKQAAVLAGIIIGNYAYMQLLIAEGRARERRKHARRSP
jgi:hypothetical protein